jgi:hypothetical protein
LALAAVCTDDCISGAPAVVAIKLNREQTEAKRAHQALDRLYQLFTASGFAPCRLDIDYAHWADQLSSDTAARPWTPFWRAEQNG